MLLLTEVEKLMKFTKVVIGALVATVIATGVHAPSAAAQFTRPIPEMAVCKKLSGGPNSAKVGELTWDFTLAYDRNGVSRDRLEYTFAVYSSNDVLIPGTTTKKDVSSRRIRFAQPGKYVVKAWVQEKNSDRFSKCNDFAVNINTPAPYTRPSVTEDDEQESNEQPATRPTTNSNSHQTNQDVSSSHDENTDTGENEDVDQNAEEEVVAQNNQEERRSEVAESTTADEVTTGKNNTPTVLPNTGASPAAVFGVTSIIGFAVDAIRRKFF